MINNTCFTAYSVLKNEDAIPFAKNGLLAVADGLGGAGSTVHVIDRSKHTDIKSELYETVLCGFDAEGIEAMREYIESQLEPMLDSEADTSALWASRIAILRFVYGLEYGDFSFSDLSEDKERENLSSFVSRGLRAVASRFGLERGKYGGQVVLPTTLAAVRYKEELDRVEIEAVWAGDSRCYVLSADGLRQLTVDDEDASGAITNLFYADTENATLNYKRHSVKKPCVIFAVSDGAFDPFDPHDNLGVEYSLLSILEASESTEDFVSKLTEYYDEIHGDDASFAFAAPGYVDFKSLKADLCKRFAYTERIYSASRRLSPTLEAMSKSEEEVRSYILSRTRDKYDRIAGDISAMLTSGEKDVILNETVRSLVREAEKKIIEERLAENQGIDALRAQMLACPDELKTRVLRFPVKILRQPCFDTLSALRRSGEALLDAKRVYAAKKKETEELLHEGEQIRARVLDIIEQCEAKWRTTVPGDDKDTIKEMREILKREHIWKNALLCLIEKTTCQCSVKMSIEDRVLLDSLNRFISREIYLERGVLAPLERALACAEGEYKEAVEGFLCLILKNKEARENMLSDEAERLLLQSDSLSVDADELRVLLEEMLRNKKEEIIPSIVESMALAPEESSVIDSYYNRTRLFCFKEFYRLRLSPSKEAEALVNELKSYKREALGMILGGADA